MPGTIVHFGKVQRSLHPVASHQFSYCALAQHSINTQHIRISESTRQQRKTPVSKSLQLITNALHCTTLHFITSHCVVLYCIAQHCIALNTVKWINRKRIETIDDSTSFVCSIQPYWAIKNRWRSPPPLLQRIANLSTLDTISVEIDWRWNHHSSLTPWNATVLRSFHEVCSLNATFISTSRRRPFSPPQSKCLNWMLRNVAEILKKKAKVCRKWRRLWRRRWRRRRRRRWCSGAAGR